MSKVPLAIRKILIDARETFLPRLCTICGKRLMRDENVICLECISTFEHTCWRGRSGNGAERIFWEKIPIVRANATLHYNRATNAAEALFALKYHSQERLGAHLGRLMAHDLDDTDFFCGIDAIVPIPLSKQRQRQRGYNQSERLAQGISNVTGIPIRCDIVERFKDNESQTRVLPHQREDNVRGIFRVCTKEDLSSKHLLIVDDVLTTGSTIMSCGKTLTEAGCKALSVLTLFVAGRKPEGPYAYEDEDDNVETLRHKYIHSPRPPKQC